MSATATARRTDSTRTDTARQETIQRRCARHAKRGTLPTRSGRYAATNAA